MKYRKMCFSLKCVVLFILYRSVQSQSSLNLSKSMITINNKTFTLNSTLTITLGSREKRPSSNTFESNEYYCKMDANEDIQQLVLDDSKGWKFPKQDVNLVLSYPKQGEYIKMHRPRYIHNCRSKEHIISSFYVDLHTDLPTNSSINICDVIEGGILKDTVTLSFTYSNISSLDYSIRIYVMNACMVTQEMVDSIECS